METPNFTPETAGRAIDEVMQQAPIPRPHHAHLVCALQYLMDQAKKVDALQAKLSDTEKTVAAMQAELEELKQTK